MTDLWGSFDPRAAARRIQERTSPPAKVAKAANPAATTPDFSQISQISPPPSASRVLAGQPWPAEEWRYRFHERAGFLEHDCHQSRQEAEQRALHELEGHWLALHPMPAGAPENGCVHCRKGAGAIDLLPHVAAGKGHFWLHQRCWPAFEKARRTEARAALAKLIPDLPEAGRDALEELLEDIEPGASVAAKEGAQ
jgi:hypothetical protein